MKALFIILAIILALSVSTSFAQSNQVHKQVHVNNYKHPNKAAKARKTQEVQIFAATFNKEERQVDPKHNYKQGIRPSSAEGGGAELNTKELENARKFNNYKRRVR